MENIIESFKNVIEDSAKNQSKIESDIYILSKEVSEHTDMINKLRFMEREFRDEQNELKFVKKNVDDLNAKVTHFEEKMHSFDRGFDSMRSSIDNLKDTLNLQLTMIIKDIDKFTKIADESKQENLSQHKDLENIMGRLVDMERKIESFSGLEEKILTTEQRVVSIPKTAATIITIVISVAAIAVTLITSLIK